MNVGSSIRVGLNAIEITSRRYGDTNELVDCSPIDSASNIPVILSFGLILPELGVFGEQTVSATTNNSA